MLLSTKARFVSALALYLLGNLLWSVLPLSRHPFGSYLFFILLYALIGLILGGGRADRGEARFWLWAGVCMALLLLLPLVPFQPLYQVSVFLVTSHVEILPALLLGICVSHLLPGRQRS